MKTQNAFAFRNFDEQRILSRPYFRKFRADCHVEDGLSDEEILAKFSAANDDSVKITQDKISAIEALMFRGTNYQKRIIRHGEKIAKFIQLLERKIATDSTVDIDQMRAQHKRARELLREYVGFMSQVGVSKMRRTGIGTGNVGSILEKISETYSALDEKRKLYYRKNFAARLKQVRRATCLTQKQFAEKKLHMSQAGYMQYETARRDPSIPTLIEIAKALNVSTDWLLGLVP